MRSHVSTHALHAEPRVEIFLTCKATCQDMPYLLVGVLVIASGMQHTHVAVYGHADEDDSALLTEGPP